MRLGDVPALLKAFFEQVGRPNFAFRYREKGLPEKLLKSRSARVVVQWECRPSSTAWSIAPTA